MLTTDLLTFETSTRYHVASDCKDAPRLFGDSLAPFLHHYVFRSAELGQQTAAQTLSFIVHLLSPCLFLRAPAQCSKAM